MRVVAVAGGELLASLQAGLGQTWGGTLEIAICATDLGALQVIEEQGRPDVLVMDLDTPGLAGIETMRGLRAQADLETMPILLVSTAPLEELEPDASGRTAALLKPVAPEDWREAIRRALAIPLFHEAPKPKPPKQETEEESAERKSERVTIDAPCTVGTQGRKVKGTLTDLSMSGARVAVEKAFAQGTMLNLAFIIPGTFPPKYVSFKVRIIRETPDGYALAFWQMDPLTRSYLGALVKKESS